MRSHRSPSTRHAGRRTPRLSADAVPGRPHPQLPDPPLQPDLRKEQGAARRRAAPSRRTAARWRTAQGSGTSPAARRAQPDQHPATKEPATRRPARRLTTRAPPVEERLASQGPPRRRTRSCEEPPLDVQGRPGRPRDVPALGPDPSVGTGSRSWSTFRCTAFDCVSASSPAVLRSGHATTRKISSIVVSPSIVLRQPSPRRGIMPSATAA